MNLYYSDLKNGELKASNEKVKRLEEQIKRLESQNRAQSKEIDLLYHMSKHSPRTKCCN